MFQFCEPSSCNATTLKWRGQVILTHSEKSSSDVCAFLQNPPANECSKTCWNLGMLRTLHSLIPPLLLVQTLPVGIPLICEKLPFPHLFSEMDAQLLQSNPNQSKPFFVSFQMIWNLVFPRDSTKNPWRIQIHESHNHSQCVIHPALPWTMQYFVSWLSDPPNSKDYPFHWVPMINLKMKMIYSTNSCASWGALSALLLILLIQNSAPAHVRAQTNNLQQILLNKLLTLHLP